MVGGSGQGYRGGGFIGFGQGKNVNRVVAVGATEGLDDGAHGGAGGEDIVDEEEVGLGGDRDRGGG